MHKSKILSSSLLLLIVICFIAAFLPIKEAAAQSPFVLLQFLFIGAFALANLLQESNRYAYSLCMMHWFFIFAFVFCGGITQFANSTYVWHLVASKAEAEYANWIVIVWIIVFWIIQRSKFVIKIGNQEKRNTSYIRYTVSSLVLFLISLFLVAIGLYPIIHGGLRVLFIRNLYGSNAITSIFSTRSIRITINSIIVGFVLWNAISALEYRKRDRTIEGGIIVVLAFIALILNVPPMAVPRYEAAAVYGGLIIYHWKRLRRGKLFIYGISIGLLIVFPFLNAFRGTATQFITIESIVNSLGNISGNYLRADYDAYTMLIYVVRYVKTFGVTAGMQLLGAILFFVPRSLWSGKPGGSGAMIIEKLFVGVNPNVSCPLFAEGYINYGFIGVALFSSILSYIIRKMDTKYWLNNNGRHSSYGMIYTCAIPYVLFLMRGDLMSTLAFFIGFVASHYLYKRLFIREASFSN